MKKSAIAVTLTCALLLTQAVFAVDTTSTGVSRKEKVQEKIDTRKENMQDKMEAMKEKMASREAEMRAKLKAFRDQKKATAAARISDNLNKINQNQTAQMQKYISTMTSILDKLEARVNSSTPDIKDPTAAKVAIASARAAIASASAAVSAQAEKDYTIQVGSEATVKSDAQKMRELLRTDLMAVRKQVIDAKQTVANAIRVAKSGKLEIPSKKEGTSSGKQ